MYERFNSSKQAVSFLCDGLVHDFPDAEAEVLVFHNRRSKCRECRVSHLASMLERYCAQYPKASVEYRPENPYGFVAEIQCHGETNSKRDTNFRRRSNDFNRPRVVILLKRIHDQDVLIGTCQVPRETPGILG
jgi:hypothetical protein